jgi:4-hydroxyphenylacetate decarboxylase small subunit
MKTANLTYRDTRDYVPIDVIKGIDLRSHEVVMADDPAPAEAEAMPKCRLCKHYTPGEDETLGTCEGSPDRFFAYADMVAVTCAMFEEKD